MDISDHFIAACQKDFPALDRQDLVMEGKIVVCAVEAVAICLMGTMFDAEKTDDGLIESVDPALYAKALLMAKDQRDHALLDDEPLDEAIPSIFTRDQMRTFAPEKTWPLMLTDAIFKKFGLVAGYLPDTAEQIFDPERKIRACEIALAENIIDEMRTQCHEFVMIGMERIAGFLGTQAELAPELLYDVVSVAIEEGRSVCGDIREWFPPSHDSYLLQQHTVQNVPPQIRNGYH